MPGWEMTVTTDTEALVRRAYHLAEGDALDVQGFINLFAEADVVIWMGKMVPDVHRELHRVNVLGDVVSIELSNQGTFLGPFQTPAGVIQPTGAKINFPTADFWYARDGS